MLMKLTTGVNIINMLFRNFNMNICSGSQLQFHQQYYAQLHQHSTWSNAQFLSCIVYAVHQ